MSNEKPIDYENPKAAFDDIMKTARDQNLRAKGIDPDAPSDEEEEDLSAFEGEEETELESEDEPVASEDESDEGELGPVDLSQETPTQLVSEKPIDKSLGEEKVSVNHTVTIEEHQRAKVAEAQKAAVAALKDLQQAQSKNLKPEDVKKLRLLVAKHEAGTLNSEIGKYLINRKASAMKTFLQTQNEVKKLQQEFLNKVASATNEIVKAKGVLEDLDKQLLELVNEDPSLLE